MYDGLVLHIHFHKFVRRRENEISEYSNNFAIVYYLNITVIVTHITVRAKFLNSQEIQLYLVLYSEI